jgi:hypothetical protein
MGMIIGMNEGLKLRKDWDLLRELSSGLNPMLLRMQEAWERDNPITKIFASGTLGGYQETFISGGGFGRVMHENGESGVARIHNPKGGFSKTYTSREFFDGFQISRRLIEDGSKSGIKQTAEEFQRAWNGDKVDYHIKALEGGFGSAVYYGDEEDGGSRLKLESADTVDGDPFNPVKNPLFTNAHKTVKWKGSTPITQSNFFGVGDLSMVGLELGGDDPAQLAKLAYLLSYIFTHMETLYNDNGKRAGVIGKKTVVAPVKPMLRAALSTLMKEQSFKGYGLNPVYDAFEVYETPYLNDNLAFSTSNANPQANGILILDSAWNKANKGIESTQRKALEVDVFEDPYTKDIRYQYRERFDINVAHWQGVAYLNLQEGGSDPWNNASNLTLIKPVSTIVKPVSISGIVTTEVSA